MKAEAWVCLSEVFWACLVLFREVFCFGFEKSMLYLGRSGMFFVFAVGRVVMLVFILSGCVVAVVAFKCCGFFLSNAFGRRTSELDQCLNLQVRNHTDSSSINTRKFDLAP